VRVLLRAINVQEIDETGVETINKRRNLMVVLA